MRPRILAFRLALLVTLSIPHPTHAASAPGAAAPAGPRPHEGDTPYVIVTTQALRGEFERLATEHSRLGLRASVSTLESIRHAFPAGRDDAERIRTFLQDAHAHHGAKWLLLGGDASVVPVRIVRVDLALLPPLTLHLAEDQYYACLDGSWNANGDSLWGQFDTDSVDIRPDLIVGRAPVRDHDEARRFVDRTIADLRRGSRREDRSALLAASSFIDGAFEGSVFTEAIRPLLSSQSVGTERLYHDWMSWPGASPETHAALLQALDDGPDLAVLVGPGAPGEFEVGGSNPRTEPFFTSTDAAALTNATPGRCYFLSGWTCAPDGANSIGRALINARRGGAVAVLGVSNDQFASVAGHVMRVFMAHAYGNGPTTLGEAMTATIAEGAVPNPFAALSVEALTLFGDPALPVRPTPIATAVAAYHAGASEPDETPEVLATVMTALPAAAHDPPMLSTATRPPGLALAAKVRQAAGAVQVDLDIPFAMNGVTYEIAVFDAIGRRIRTLERGQAVPGPRSVTWDTRSDAGIRVRSGVYFVTARSGSYVTTARVAVVR